MGSVAHIPHYVTLEEFDAMDFGDRTAELIDGMVVVAQSFPTDRHAIITNTLGALLYNEMKASKRPCRIMVGAGLPIRMIRDFHLGPDVMVRCDAIPETRGTPVLVAEVLSPSNSASEMLKKLRAYQFVEGLTDILVLEQDVMSIDQWTRRPDGSWSGSSLHMEGPDAVLRIERFQTEWPLAAIYGDADVAAYPEA